MWVGDRCSVAGRAGALSVCEQATFIAAAGPRLGPVAERVVGQLRGTGRTWTGKQAGTKACRTTPSKLGFFFHAAMEAIMNIYGEISQDIL